MGQAWSKTWRHTLSPPADTAPGVLVRAGGPITIDDAALRAITLRQLKACLRHAQCQCEMDNWLRNGAQLSPSAITLYDVADHVILPLTRAHPLPDSTPPAYVELGTAPTELRPRILVP
jgi:hypothetical protein